MSISIIILIYRGICIFTNISDIFIVGVYHSVIMLIQYKINKIDKISEVTNTVKVAKEKSINEARKLIDDKSIKV